MITEQQRTEGLNKFASEISSEPLVEVYHRPEDGARLLACFQNVRTKVERDGGDILFGWTFRHCFTPECGDYLVATNHAVCWFEGDRLLDVTPYQKDYHPLMARKDYVIFLVDRAAEFKKIKNFIVPLPLKYFSLSDNQKLRDNVKQKAQQAYKEFQDEITGYLRS